MLAAQEASVECASPAASRPCFLSGSWRRAQSVGLSRLGPGAFWLWADLAACLSRCCFVPERSALSGSRREVAIHFLSLASQLSHRRGTLSLGFLRSVSLSNKSGAGGILNPKPETPSGACLLLCGFLSEC